MWRCCSAEWEYLWTRYLSPSTGGETMRRCRVPRRWRSPKSLVYPNPWILSSKWHYVITGGPFEYVHALLAGKVDFCEACFLCLNLLRVSSIVITKWVCTQNIRLHTKMHHGSFVAAASRPRAPSLGYPWYPWAPKSTSDPQKLQGRMSVLDSL